MRGTGLVISILFLSTSALADVPNPITNFHEVSSGIYRGARPLQAGIEYLSTELDVKTDLDIENDKDAIAAETGFASAQEGLTFISIPLSGFWAPSDADVNRALELLEDPSKYPIYLHCEHGEDRTGLIVGLFRVLYQHVSPADAYQEMLADGFHPSLIFFEGYFDKATGYYPGL